MSANTISSYRLEFYVEHLRDDEIVAQQEWLLSNYDRLVEDGSVKNREGRVVKSNFSGAVGRAIIARLGRAGVRNILARAIVLINPTEHIGRYIGADSLSLEAYADLPAVLFERRSELNSQDGALLLNQTADFLGYRYRYTEPGEDKTDRAVKRLADKAEDAIQRAQQRNFSHEAASLEHELRQQGINAQKAREVSDLRYLNELEILKSLLVDDSPVSNPQPLREILSRTTITIGRISDSKKAWLVSKKADGRLELLLPPGYDGGSVWHAIEAVVRADRK